MKMSYNVYKKLSILDGGNREGITKETDKLGKTAD
jgi:hypothetical protein